MSYTQLTFEFSDTNEVSYIYAGNYGAKGEKRQEKRKATPEQIRYQNQRNRENRTRRLIKANFRPYDLWCTLKYPAGTHKTPEELKADFNKFIRKLKYRYKKHGVELKYIYRMEIGARGGLHVHILINRIVGAPTDVYIKDAWGYHTWHENLYEEGGYQKLAEYLTKKPSDQIAGQLSLFTEEEQEQLLKVNSSRNLIRPVPVKKDYSHWTMKRILDSLDEGDYTTWATPGYLIEKDSVQQGINPFTGMSYLRYTERKIRGKT